MVRASFRFYAELNDFLQPSRRHCAFDHLFAAGAAVKDTIESLGVPHTEVDLVLVNGRPVDFDHAVQDGDRVSVYPVFESIDIGAVARVRPRPLRESRFILDTHLGRLARYLRLGGLDTEYPRGAGDAELAARSRDEHRVLLTRDQALLKRRAVSHGYFVRATRPADQLVEVFRRFDLTGSLRPFSRCMRCNGLIDSIPAALVQDRLPEMARLRHSRFWQCRQCRQTYWEGSHHARLTELLDRAVRAARSADPGRPPGQWS